jgi:drug/metabolite transporter (DMT)-like permease
VLAALVLWLVMRLRGFVLPRQAGLWARFAAIAVLGNVTPFALISWGEQRIDSGLAAILMSTMPLATAALAHAFTQDERLTRWRASGVACGFSGVVVLVGPDALGGLGGEVTAQLAVVLAACGYAAASIVARGLYGLSAVVTGTGVLLVAAAIAVPASLAFEQPWSVVPSALSLAAVVALALLCTATAYMILFRLVTTVGATFLAMNNYLVPLFGVVWGALILNERVSATALAALALVLAGIALTQVRGARPART